jgi:hypothetical protein
MRNICGLSLGVVCSLLALVGCGGSGNPGGQSPAAPASSPSAHAVRIVALGDSDATGTGDPTGQGWAGRYAALVHQATGSPVHVTNLASDGKTSDVLLTEVRVGPRHAASPAGRPGRPARDRRRGPQPGRRRPAGGPVQGPRLLFTAAAPVRPQRRRDTRHRAPAGWPLRADPGDQPPQRVPRRRKRIPAVRDPRRCSLQAVTERTIVCGAARKHGGDCINVVRAFNGSSGTGDAYQAGLMTKDPCCYPSAKASSSWPSCSTASVSGRSTAESAPKRFMLCAMS